MKNFKSYQDFLNESLYEGKIDPKLQKELDKLLDEFEENIENGIVKEGTVTTIGAVIAVPAVLGLISKFGRFANKMHKKIIGKEVDPNSELEKYMAKMSKLADDLHHMYLKPIELIVGKFIKDKDKAHKVSNFILHAIVATLLFAAGATSISAFNSKNYSLSLLEGLLTAIKSGELRQYITKLF